ncbi:nuclear transport factor 2 family protein [Fodinicola feengrottensis]|uniref:nuclear transport factor 2 family protein n=1 Tax=Fodinicola feengrottensis TaxID=435914 RepID=UPI0036F21A42
MTDLITMHGHLVDADGLNRIEEVFAQDAVHDLTDFGLGIRDLPTLREAAIALGDNQPVGHHVTNIVLSELPDGQIRVLPKGIGINADGTCGSVTYDDVVSRREQGWRITYRKVSVRKAVGVRSRADH